MPKFTEAQLSAINEQSKTLLVSAAAGSGKTFTLVQRVLRSVVRKENPIPLDRLLVVTFTKDTASDLRQRISAAVSDALASDGENEYLARQLSLLPSAKISTIDSFYLSLVRENYASLGLSPSFRLADESEAELIGREMMDRLINSCYDDPSSKICGGPHGFAELVDLLVGSSSDSRLCDLMLSLYDTVNSYPAGASALTLAAKSLRSYTKSDFFDCPYGMRIKQYINELISHYKDAYKAAIAIMESDEKLATTYCITFEEDYAKILKAKSALEEGYAEGKAAIEAIDFPTIKTYKGEKSPLVENIKKIRDDFKADIKDVKAKYLVSFGSDIKNDIKKSADICDALGEFLSEYERILEAEKKRKNICTFSDLSRYSLRLLIDENGNDTPLANEQKKLYDAIYIDEYQDVNAVQNRIFEAISTSTNRFMVGDIKQSIYAFRGAEPTIFSELRYKYPDIENAKESDYATLFMSRNFRCSEDIIDFTNHICDFLMPMISPDMHYSEKDALVFGKEKKSNEHLPIEVVICEKPGSKSVDRSKNTEAEYIADEIFKLIHGGKKEDGSPIAPDDIAILMRSPKSRVDVFSSALTKRGIPVYASTEESLLMQSEVEIVRSLISAVDNPRRDIDLTGVLLSPIVGIDASTLAKMRSKNSSERLITTVKSYCEGDGEVAKILTPFVHKLDELRKMARFMSAGEFMDALYADMAIFAVLGGESRIRRANLEKFRQTAYSFSGSTGATLSSFLRYLRSAEENGTAISAAKAGAETSGAVRIMSVHKSKGLEFPVVFYADTHHSYNLSDNNLSLLYTNSGGFGIKLRDPSGFCTCDTLLRKSVSLSSDRAAKEEELRTLYVALTRAREKLYVTAMHSKPDKLFESAEFENKIASPYLALAKDNHLALTLLALGKNDLPFVTYKSVPHVESDAEAEDCTDSVQEEEVAVSEEYEKLIASRFSYSYGHKARTKIPAKLSISRLYPDVLDDEILEVSVEGKPLPKATVAPRFIESSENVAARRGTATHLFMQFFDFENVKQKGVHSELERLKEKRFITDDDASLVSLSEVERFVSSSLFKSMCNADRLYREQRFNLHLPAKEFASDEALKKELEDKQILVQGVIDCFFYDSDGEIVLVDYKTDRAYGESSAAADKLRETYSRQLTYYARAIEEICGKPPKSKIIYSLALGEEIIV